MQFRRPVSRNGYYTDLDLERMVKRATTQYSLLAELLTIVFSLKEESLPIPFNRMLPLDDSHFLIKRVLSRARSLDMAGNPYSEDYDPPSILPACGEGCFFVQGRKAANSIPQVHISSPGLQVAVVSDSFCFDPLPVARHQRPYQLPAGVSGVRIAKPLLNDRGSGGPARRCFP